MYDGRSDRRVARKQGKLKKDSVCRQTKRKKQTPLSRNNERRPQAAKDLRKGRKAMYNVEDPTLGLCREDYENRYKEIVGVCDECGDYIYEEEECYDEGDVLCFKCFEERMKENREETRQWL